MHFNLNNNHYLTGHLRYLRGDCALPKWQNKLTWASVKLIIAQRKSVFNNHVSNNLKHLTSVLKTFKKKSWSHCKYWHTSATLFWLKGTTGSPTISDFWAISLEYLWKTKTKHEYDYTRATPQYRDTEGMDNTLCSWGACI